MAQTSMSNAQRGTTVLSAGDWIRMKRLIGAGKYKTVNLDTNKDIEPATQPQLPYSLPIHVSKTVGTSKIRRSASSWTDYIAFQNAVYVVPFASQVASPPIFGNKLLRLCDCSVNEITTKQGVCTKCVVPTHVRLM